MTKEQLQERLEKKLAQIAKVEKLIAKLETKISNMLNTKAVEIIKEAAVKPTYKERQETLDLVDIAINLIEDYGTKCELNDKVDQLYNNYRKLEELKPQAKDYQVKLEKLVNFANEDKIQVIVDFLNSWKEKAYQWYLNNANEYINLKANYQAAINKAWEEDKKYYEGYGRMAYYYFESAFNKNYYNNITALTKSIVGYNGMIDTGTLNIALEAEKDRKYKDLVNRVTKAVGTIEDASLLSIAVNGEINGLVKGSNATARVNTISAGGYNIQCFHYRVLVNLVK